ncbi:MAG: hypothetical protein ACRDRH_02465 [Pseudonocardia sp.]
MTKEPGDGRRRQELDPQIPSRGPRPAPRDAVPIARVLSLPARVPLRERPDCSVVADVPFIALPVVEWGRATSGAPLADLIGLLQHRGGRWLAQHTKATIARTVTADPCGHVAAVPVRLEVHLDGVWTGRFAASAPANEVADHLRALARSPILAFVPDEIADRVVPASEPHEPLTWLGLSQLLDDVLHVTSV